MNAWEIQRDGGINALVPVERAKPSPGARDLVVRVRAVSLDYRDLLHVLGKPLATSGPPQRPDHGLGRPLVHR